MVPNEAPGSSSCPEVRRRIQKVHLNVPTCTSFRESPVLTWGPADARSGASVFGPFGLTCSSELVGPRPWKVPDSGRCRGRPGPGGHTGRQTLKTQSMTTGRLWSAVIGEAPQEPGSWSNRGPCHSFQLGWEQIDGGQPWGLVQDPVVRFSQLKESRCVPLLQLLDQLDSDRLQRSSLCYFRNKSSFHRHQ